jgi:signal transduction histidine kinase
VFFNILLNAVDSLDRPGTITVITEHDPLDGKQRRGGSAHERYFAVRIRDTGVGMSEEVVSRIFDPYFTTKQQKKGTGLGLAIVYSIMNNYGGHIQVQSTPSIGTTFSLFFPYPKRP